MDPDYKPPAEVRGMKSLDQESFKTKIAVPAFKVDCKQIPSARKILSSIELKNFPGIKPIQPAVEKEKKLILIQKQDDAIIEEFGAKLNAAGTDSAVTEKELELEFGNFSLDAIFEAVLPEGVSGIKKFSQIGHIVHLNLRDEHIPFKKIIGEIFLEKLPTCKTVINKDQTIESQFRNLSLELLAGEANYVATVKEKGCKFAVDMSKVFWNPRLSTEHHRIVSKHLSNGSVVYDVFAGVGPFAVPAAKAGCAVIANDLNPDSVEYLRKNEKLNNVKFDSTHNLDGAEFIRKIVGKDLARRLEQRNLPSSAHAIMNLPALAPTFIPNFVGILRPFTGKGTISNSGSSLTRSGHEGNGASSVASKDLTVNCDSSEAGSILTPESSESGSRCPSNEATVDAEAWIPFFVHCHLFSRSEDFVSDAKAQILEQLKGFEDGVRIAEVHNVRNVAPGKEMMCVSFELNSSVLCAADSNCEEPIPKKPCLEG